MQTIKKDKILISKSFHIFPNGEVNCFHERNNPFDMFAVQVCQLSTFPEIQSFCQKEDQLSQKNYIQPDIANDP